MAGSLAGSRADADRADLTDRCSANRADLTGA
jgi:hypothetical protein